MNVLSCSGCGASPTSSQSGIYFKCEYCGRVNFLKDRELPDFDDAMLDLAEKAFRKEVRDLNHTLLKYNDPESRVSNPRFYSLLKNHYKNIADNFISEYRASAGEPLPIQNKKSLQAIGVTYGLWQIQRILVEFDENFYKDATPEEKLKEKKGTGGRAWNRIPEYVLKGYQQSDIDQGVKGYIYNSPAYKHFLIQLKNARFRGLQQSEEEVIIGSYLSTIALIWKNLFRQLFNRIIALLPIRILEKDEALFALLLSFYWTEMQFKEEVISIAKYTYDHYNKEYGFDKDKFIGWITIQFFTEEVTPTLEYPFADYECLKRNLNFQREPKKDGERFPLCTWALENVSKENDFIRYPLKKVNNKKTKTKSKTEIESNTFQDIESEGQGCLFVLALIGTSSIFVSWLVLSPAISSINIIN